MVQGIHAVAEFCLNYFDGPWQNERLVVLGVKNIERWKRKLEFNEETHSCFYEPDLNNELTAIACFSDGELFKNLNLFKAPVL